MVDVLRASEKALEELHNTIAKGYSREIKKYMDGEYKDGDGEPVPIPAALLAGAARFLKDNQIDRPEDEEPDPADLLADELPSFGDD